MIDYTCADPIAFVLLFQAVRSQVFSESGIEVPPQHRIAIKVTQHGHC
jgi:hypothetical protein